MDSEEALEQVLQGPWRSCGVCRGKGSHAVDGGVKCTNCGGEGRRIRKDFLAACEVLGVDHPRVRIYRQMVRGTVPRSGPRPSQVLIDDALDMMENHPELPTTREDALEVVLRGVVYVTCPECKGRRVVEKEGDASTTMCAECDGSGDVTSPAYTEACTLLGINQPPKKRSILWKPVSNTKFYR